LVLCRSKSGKSGR